MKEEIGWMIEATGFTGPQWWTGNSLDAYAFSSEPNDGVRFARQQDAEYVRNHLFPETLRLLSRSTEHIWPEPEKVNS